MVDISEIVQSTKDLISILAIFGIAIELTPIKINPLKWIGRRLNSDISNELAQLRRDFEITKANNMRWEILNFANGCRRGIRHSKDEWHHVLNIIREYEEYTTKKKILNGVIEEDSKYLRELYSECNHENNFFIRSVIKDGHSDDNR